MPTGYTADLHDGKPQSFEEFLFECARAFGALITMRDDPRDTPIPDEFTPSTKYHDEALVRAEERMAELRRMTPEEIIAGNLAERATVLGQRAKEAVARKDRRQRYEAMLAEVEAWDPPTEEHQGLKTFMAQQLNESIRFDCAEVRYPEMPPEDPAVWFEQQVAKVEWDLKYHAEKRAEEIERTRGRNEWVAALRASVSGSAAADA